MLFFVRIALGFLFFLIGVAGLFLPLLQGWLFLMISAILFFPNHRLAQKVVARCRVKFPRIYGLLRKVGIEDESDIDGVAGPSSPV